MQVNNLIVHRAVSEVWPWQTDSQMEQLYKICYNFFYRGFSIEYMFKMLKLEVKITASCSKLSSLHNKLHGGGSKIFSIILKR